MSSAEESPSLSSPSPATKKRKVEEIDGGIIDNIHNLPVGEATQQIFIGGVEAETGSSPVIQESLCSSLLYTLGPEAMSMIATSNILISGLGGLGAEISKHIILGGVKSVTLHDASPVQASEVGSNIFLSEADIGMNRAEASARRLSELNANVPVHTSSADLTEEFLQSFRVVVLTNSNFEERLRVADIVRRFGNAFIVAQTRGLFAQIFADYGPDFTVIDPSEDDPKRFFVVHISKDEEGCVNCTDQVTHGFKTGDYVTFSGVRGMVELNDGPPRPIKVISPYSFSIGDTSGLSAYERGGVVTASVMPQKVHFQPLAQALDEPKFLITERFKADLSAQIHLAFRTLDVWVTKEGRLPNPWSRSDSKSFYRVAQEVNHSITGGAAKVAVVDEDLIKKFSHVCKGALVPIDGTVGGIVALEVFKACTGKFMPVMQWLYLDGSKCLPENCNLLTEEQCKPTGSRYDGQIAIFGKDFQKSLGEMKVMVAGAGVLGCEHLKNLAMVGVGAGAGGQIYISDMGRVKSITQHFLFRPRDLQKAKSSTAVAAVLAMIPTGNITALEKHVGPENEIFFNTCFGHLNGVVSAVDSAAARIYLDEKCSLQQKFLLDSRSSGITGKVQVIIPDLSETYNSVQDQSVFQSETLDTFPNAFEHAVRWARATFETNFNTSAECAARFLTDPEFMARTLNLPDTQPLKVLQDLKRALVTERPVDFQDCVNWARLHFEDQFYTKIAQLLAIFPPDDVTSSEKPFWTGRKFCPRPIIFDVNDDGHLDFIISAANLRALNYGIPQSRDRQAVAAMLVQRVMPNYVNRTGGRLAMPNAAAASSVCDEALLEKLQAEIPPASSFPGLCMLPLEFDKEDDSNFHMDYICATSILRATNYGISVADRKQCKWFVGKINPILSTTASVISGLVGLELLKIAQGHGDLDIFKNCFVNLASPTFMFTRPGRSKSYQVPSWFYPTTREHTDEWAKNLLRNLLAGERPPDFQSCVKRMRFLFDTEFRNNIDQLRHTFRAGCSKGIGEYVWPLEKRRPQPLPFDPANNFHVDFVLSGASIVARAYDIPIISERQVILDMLLDCVVPAFTPLDGLNIPTFESERAAGQMETPPMDRVIAYDPGDDAHVTFVSLGSRFRSQNYHLPTGRQRRRRH